MNRIVLDASALLALFNMEPGSDIVEKSLPFSIISTVNVAEVIAELDKKLNITPQEGKKLIHTAVDRIIPLDFNQAAEIGALRKVTDLAGLSLGDRACITLGIQMKCPVYTSDRAWKRIDLGCEVILIR